MKLLTVVGARPQFIKASVVSRAFHDADIQESIVHTGQHYDLEMSGIFWEELGLPAPSVNLEVGSAPHGQQTARIMERLESYILDQSELPDGLILYGDTNSTIAGALVASKLHIPVIHIEAGLRSFNRKMPEEINRVLTDHCSDLLFCSSETGASQLRKEGIDKGVFVSGDVMYDAQVTFSDIAVRKINRFELIPDVPGEYVLMTVHRPANTDHPERLKSIFKAIEKIKRPVVWPVHPRNSKQLGDYSLPSNVITIKPVSYFGMIVLLQGCEKVLTDSGGLQKEAYWMNKQCITLRQETEWVETLEGGWNTLTGASTDKILSAFQSEPTGDWKQLYGDGHAASHIAEIISRELKSD